MNLYFFPKYTQIGPSSRYRIYQYLGYFDDYKINVFPFFDESYSPAKSYKSIKGIIHLIKLYLRRLNYILKIKPEDIVYVQYEFTPFLPFFSLFFKLKKIKFIVDFDDAAFHDYDQHKNVVIRKLFSNKISNVIKNSVTVITGSPYLTKYALLYNEHVIEIPTSIDINKYSLSEYKNIEDKLVIGWVGSITTSVNLLALIPVFEYLKNENYNFEIRLLGFNVELASKFKDLPIKIIPWESGSEVENIYQFSVGIMPLENKPFNKGKCAFKLIQYMACGIPTISTPLEANVKVNRGNFNLFAQTTQDWINALNEIKNNPLKYKKVGLQNRKIVDKFYTIQVNKEKYIKVFDSIKRQEYN